MIKKISGNVVHGASLGNTLGFPTANIAYSNNELLSAVFKVNVVLDGEVFPGMWCYAQWKDIFEVHIFDFDSDIYDQEIDIYLLQEIRKNQKFKTPQELKNQLQKDKQHIQEIQHTILTFGSFDVVHKWHEYYLSESRKYGDVLITIIATDTNIERIKWHPPLHNQAERKIAIEQLSISDTVIIGSDSNPMKWLEKYTPEVICLGYDQRGKFVEQLPEEFEKLWLHTSIVRVPALEPEIYKSSLIKKRDLS